MSRRGPDGGSSQHSPPLTPADFEATLAWIETALRDLNARRTTLAAIRTGRTAVMIAFVIGGLFTGLATSPAVLFLALAGGVLGGVALFMWTERILLAGIVERIGSDERTVVQAGNLVRELLGVAAGDWSELRRQVAQLRMGRFPIAPEERT